MVGFPEYNNLIRQFHQALAQRDQEALRSLLSDAASLNLDKEFSTLKKLNLPLSEDIDITGIALEGSGDVVSVYYTQRVANHEYSMVAYLLRVGETIKLDHWLPQLRK